MLQTIFIVIVRAHFTGLMVIFFKIAMLPTVFEECRTGYFSILEIRNNRPIKGVIAESVLLGKCPAHIFTE